MNRRDAIKTAIAALSTPVLSVPAKLTPKQLFLKLLRKHGKARAGADGKIIWGFYPKEVTYG